MAKTTGPEPNRILDALFETAPEFLVVLDPDLGIRKAGTAFLEATGGAADRARSFLETVEQFSLSRMREVFEKLRSEQGVHQELDINHRTPDGETVTIAYTWMAMTADGECEGFVGIGREAAGSAPAEGEIRESEPLRQELESIKAKLDLKIREVSRLREQMERQATSDELTGLGNRRFLMDRLELEAARAIRYDEPMTLVLVDVDRMTHVNETHGQEKGDEVIKRVAEIVQEQIRTSDIAGRYGGEEFMVLCPHTDRANAQFLAERLRRRVSELHFSGEIEGEVTDFGVTVSVGLVTVTGHNEFDVEAILHAAEQALESAKTGGMNRVRVLEVI